VRFASEGNEPRRLGLILGEPDGSTTPRLHAIVQAFSAAHIEVAVELHIDAWLKGHVALVAPILFALNRHGSDNQTLARDWPRKWTQRKHPLSTCACHDRRSSSRVF
jgi:ketopantoate reductase